MSYRSLPTFRSGPLARTVFAATALCAVFLSAPVVASEAVGGGGQTPAAAQGAAATSSSSPAQDVADDAALARGLALATAKNCMACHQVDSRRVGPPFASVAKRYGPGDGLSDYLAKTIREGGRGRWGAVPMPAQPRVSDTEAKELAKWILSLPVSP